VFWSVTLVLFLATEYFASSRGGWISGTAAVTVTLVLSYTAVYGFDLRVLKRRLKDFGWSRSILLFLGLLVLAFGLSMLVLRQGQSAPGHAPVSTARTGIWKPAWTIFLRSPIWGHGPGSFSVLYAQEKGLPPGFATSHAHNILLQIGVENGALGLVLGAAVAVYVLRAFVRAWQRSSKTVRWKLASYAGALTAFGLHHLVDFLLESPAYAAGVVILLASLDHFSPRSERVSLASRSAWAALTGMVLLQSAGVLYLARGSLSYWRGVEAGRAGRWEEAGEAICKSADVNSAIPLYRFQCGLAQAYVYFSNQDQSALHTAQASISRGLAMDPHWPVHWVNLAALQWQAGDPTEALKSMQRAVDSAPRNPHFQLILAWMKAEKGYLDGALQSADQALDLDPWLAGSMVFQQEPFRQIGVGSERTVSMSIREGLAFMGWQELDRGQFDQAQAHFNQALSAGLGPPQAYAGLALVLGKQDEFTHAERLFMEAVFLHGLRPDLLAAGSELARLQGDFERANYLTEEGIRATMDHSYSQPYYSRAYLRYYLAPDFVPWLRCLTFDQQLLEQVESDMDQQVESLESSMMDVIKSCQPLLQVE
jgi:Flp pilus assembly protein TadD